MFSAENNDATPKRNLFGVSLADLFSTEPHHPDFEIPLFLATIILFIDSHGHIPGIFKIKADNDEIDRLIRRFENGDRVDLQNPHAVAGLLVAFLIFLPEPVLFNNYSQYIEAAKRSDITALQKLVHYLPAPHYLVLRAILLLLHHLAVDERIDVGSSELAQIMTPLLLMGPVASMEADMEEIITLGELLIAEYALILAPLKGEDYAKLPRSTYFTSSHIPLQAPQLSPFSPSQAQFSQSPPNQSQLAPFQKSKYEVNYEPKLSSLSLDPSNSSQLSSTPPRSVPTSHYTFTAQSPTPTKGYSSLPRSASPTRPSSSPSPTRISPANTLQKPDSLLVGIYGSDPGLKYTQSTEKLRQLDVRFEEMVENMQEKRSLFLNQIESIRKRLVRATPGLRWEPPPPRPSTNPARATTPTTPFTPPRTPSPSVRSASPAQLSRQALRRSSGTSSPVSRSPEPRSYSPGLTKPSPPPLLHISETLEIKQEEKEQGPTEAEQNRSSGSLTGEERDLEYLHNYYYGKMKVLYSEIQNMKSTIKALQRDVTSAKNETLELQDASKQKDERICQLELECERLKNPEEASKQATYRPLLPPERKAPSPPGTPPVTRKLVN